MKIANDLGFLKILVGKLTRPLTVRLADREFNIFDNHRGYLEIECVETKEYEPVNSPRELVNFLVNNTPYILGTTDEVIYKLFVQELYKVMLSPSVGVTFEDIDATIASLVESRPEEMTVYLSILRSAKQDIAR